MCTNVMQVVSFKTFLDSYLSSQTHYIAHKHPCIPAHKLIIFPWKLCKLILLHLSVIRP